nr:hypothetical protein [Mitsuokella sp. AF33-22]
MEEAQALRALCEQLVAGREVKVGLPGKVGTGGHAARAQGLLEIAAREDVELVEVHAVDIGLRERPDVREPRRKVLSRQPVDEVGDDRHILPAQKRQAPQHFFPGIDAADAAAQCRVERLHAERDPVDAAGEPRLDLLRHEVVDAAFHGHLRIRCQMELLPHGSEQSARVRRRERSRRAAAEEHTVNRGRADLLQLRIMCDFLEQRLDVGILGLLAAGLLIKGAVEAFRLAERDVDVNGIMNIL